MASTRAAAVVLALAAGTARAQAPAFQLDPFGDNAIRVRVAPPGNGIVQPPLQALLDSPPATRTRVARADANSLTNGNLAVAVDPQTGFLTATRVSDGRVLLTQTGLSFGPVTVPGTRAGTVSAAVTFAGTPGEKVFGLGEHRTGAVNQMPYAHSFQDSQVRARRGAGERAGRGGPLRRPVGTPPPPPPDPPPPARALAPSLPPRRTTPSPTAAT